jgi:hypothetical protein
MYVRIAEVGLREDQRVHGNVLPRIASRIFLQPHQKKLKTIDHRKSKILQDQFENIPPHNR